MNIFSQALNELNKSLLKIQEINTDFNKNIKPSTSVYIDDTFISFEEIAQSIKEVSTFNDKSLEIKNKIYSLLLDYVEESELYNKVYCEKQSQCNKFISDIVEKTISNLPEDVFNYTNAIRVHKKLDLDEFILKNNLPHITNEWKTQVFVNESNAVQIQNLLFEEAISKMEGESKQVKSNTKGLLKIENFIEKDKPDLSKIQMILEALSKQ